MNEMARTAATKARSAARAPARSGRPPNELAGEVEERILDAARKMFLDRGFEGASIEEIAGVARSGKPTIYARFRAKRTLLTAAVARYVVAKETRLVNFSPSGKSLEQRLANIGETLLQEALTPERIDLLRLAIAEARRFPDLGSIVIRVTRERGAEIMIRLLSREHLLQATRIHEDIFDRSIDVQVLRLRRKLETDPSAPRVIQTERGVGYVFALPVESF